MTMGTAGRRRTGRALMAAGVVAALALAGCASGDGGGGGAGRADDGAVTVGFIDGDQAAQLIGDPAGGGEVTFGSYGFPDSLDPAVTPVAGFTGGTELAAIYDTLMRADADSGEFVPQLAESLEVNGDLTEYTLTLRPGTVFSDGSELDAQAVAGSIDRFVAGGADVAWEWSQAVAEVTTPDARTVVFTLTEPWAGFPILLSMGPGMIVGAAADEGEVFRPVGAGPFEVDRFDIGSELVLRPRADYVGGRPHLAQLTFVPSGGAAGGADSLDAGQLDAVFVYRDDDVIDRIVGSGAHGYLDSQGLGALVMINNRDDRPGADPRVREAIALGVDAELVDQRVNSGLGVTDPAIMPPGSRWAGQDSTLGHDPDRAAALLAEAKADGYDGRLTYLATADPSAQEAAQAVQASLGAVGFDVQVDTAPTVTDQVRRMYIDHDFDITRSGEGLLDEDPFLRLYSSLGSDSANNASGYADDQMDALLTEVKTAPTDDERRAVIGRIQERFDATVPYAVLGPSTVLVAWDPDVRGVVRSVDNIVLFDRAWVS